MTKSERKKAVDIIFDGYKAHPEISPAVYRRYSRYVRDYEQDSEAYKKLIDLDMEEGTAEETLRLVSKYLDDPSVSEEAINEARTRFKYEDRFDGYRWLDEYNWDVPKTRSFKRGGPSAELPCAPTAWSEQDINYMYAENERIRRAKEVQRVAAYREKQKEENPELVKEKQRLQSKKYREAHKDELNAKARARAKAKRDAIPEEEKRRREYEKLKRRQERLQATLDKYTKL